MKITISTKSGQKTLDFSEVASKIKQGAKSVAHSSRIAAATVLEDVSETINNVKEKAKPADYDDIQKQREEKKRKLEAIAKKTEELKAMKAGV